MSTEHERYPLNEEEIEGLKQFLKGNDLRVIADPHKPERSNIFYKFSGSTQMIETDHIDGCFLVLDCLGKEYVRSVVDEYMVRR